MAGARWSVYLIVSTQLPRSYVGVTTHFPRRITVNSKVERRHVVQEGHGLVLASFMDLKIRVKITVLFVASEFEWKWKRLSRKLQRGKAAGVEEKHGVCVEILGKRELALKKVRDSCSCSHLEVDWKITSQTYRISTC